MSTRTLLDIPLEGSQTEISSPALSKPFSCSQAIADDSSGHKSIIMEDSGLQSPVPSKNPLDLRAPWAIYPSATLATADDDDGSGLNGGHTHRLNDPFSGECCLSSSSSASNVPSASTRRDTSDKFASTTPSSDTPKSHGLGGDIRDANNTSSEQSPSSSSDKSDAFLQSGRTPLSPIRSSALPNPIGASDARSQGSARCADGDVPKSCLSNDTESLPDSVVPDLTHEIHNKTLVVHGRCSLVFCADREESQGSLTKVALKVFWPWAPENERVDKTLKRLKREVRVWMSLKHPNIVPLLGLFSGELGRDIGLVSGKSGLVLFRLGTHKANVVVASDGRAALCDFGLSMIRDMTGFTTSSICGTLPFMAPEQFNGDFRSPRSDVYAYACTYVQIMTGDLPFAWYKNIAPIVRAICEGESPYKIETITSHHNLEFLGLSWDPEPARRPTISDICCTLGMS
ncbi:hypothetical protein BS47DRAFT_1363354 [Hydnum rufescens UP504]|uniref:Protein kinase domain-containing protein n=1 Tax=Hydnum rufescens UP504 TaxID=1448309 RepID=A0A9P6DRH4_9AGAM|nr:hypothetical protein BS47DRAFT_1363354 [Hydnum rufescens UP504]